MSETTEDSHRGNNLNFICFVFFKFILSESINTHRKTIIKRNKTQDMIGKN